MFPEHIVCRSRDDWKPFRVIVWPQMISDTGLSCSKHPEQMVRMPLRESKVHNEFKIDIPRKLSSSITMVAFSIVPLFLNLYRNRWAVMPSINFAATWVREIGITLSPASRSFFMSRLTKNVLPVPARPEIYNPSPLSKISLAKLKIAS